LGDLRLIEHPEWFEPFVLHWMRLSKVNAEIWVSNALRYDTWEPVAVGEQFSTSVLDVFRVVYEILSFWERLQWQHTEAAEEHLFAELSASVCGCVHTFCQLTVEHILQVQRNHHGHRSHHGRGGVGGHGDATAAEPDMARFSDGALCTGLNNLAEAAKQLQILRREMKVEAVAESHLERARRSIEGHSGRLLEHRAVSVFRKTENALRHGMQALTADIATVIRPRLHGDLDAIIRGFNALQTPTSPSAFASTALSGLLDQEAFERVEDADEPESKVSAARWLLSLTSNLRIRQQRRTSKVDELQQDGYLNTLLMLFASELQHEHTVNMVAHDVFEVLLGCLADILLDYDAEAQRERIVPLMGALLSELQQFFHGDGDGVNMEVLDACADRTIKPLLRSCLYDVEDLITQYYQCAGTHFGNVIRAASGLAHGEDGIVDEASGRPILASRAVSATATPSGIVVRMRLSQRGLGGGKLSIRVLDVTGAPGGPTYLVVRVMPSFERKPYKAKTSSRAPAAKGRVPFDEVITLAHVRGGVVLEVRVKVGGTKVSKGTVVGEALIPVALLPELTLDQAITVPLSALSHHGRISELQHLIKQRAGMHREAKHFITEYPHLKAGGRTGKGQQTLGSPVVAPIKEADTTFA